jgi:hypothetical protein
MTMAMDLALLLEERAGQPRLADDRLQGPDAQLAMVRDGDGDGRVLQPPLHHEVIAVLADLDEAMLNKDAADLATREDAQSTQRPPRGW